MAPVVAHSTASVNGGAALDTYDVALHNRAFDTLTCAVGSE